MSTTVVVPALCECKHLSTSLSLHDVGDALRIAAIDDPYLDVFADADAEARMVAAADFLQRYIYVVNRSSDGWSYWRQASVPAESLQRVISHLNARAQNGPIGTCEGVSVAEIEKAIHKIELFCKRKSLDVPTRLPLTHAEAQRQREEAERAARQVMDRIELETLLHKYVSDDDVTLPKADFLRIVRDRISDDLAAQ